MPNNRRPIEDLNRRADQRPVAISIKATAKAVRIVVLSGQTLVSGQIGVKYSGSFIEEFAAAYDPETEDTFPDGIGRGDLYLPGETEATKVLIINDPRGGFNHALLGSGMEAVWGFFRVSVPVAGGGSKSAWIVG